MKTPTAPFFLDFGDGLVHHQGRRHAHPAQPVGRLFPDIDQPTVVGPRQRDLGIGVLGQAGQPHRWKQHLDVDPEIVHVAQAQGDIAHLPRGLRGCHVAARGLRHFLDLIVGKATQEGRA
jgi:hypothetical protein